MVTEEEKFRAETFRIFGIIFLTPLGKILIDPLAFCQEHDLTYNIIYSVLALISAYIGLTHIEIARATLDKKNKDKQVWN